MLKPLSEEDRLKARDQARRNIIRRAGPRPQREQFRSAVQSEYPRWLTATSAVTLIAVFLAAASISTFRLYAAGRDFFLESLPILWQAQVVGIATAVMAEFLVITASSAATILFRGRARALAAIPIAIGLLVAFVGNHEVTQASTLWGWLDTIAPPLAVLSVGIMLERVILLSLRERWDNERAYQAALAKWQAATADPENSSEWMQAYASALRDQLRAVNARGRGKEQREAIMASMGLEDWRALVQREIDAENWFARTGRDSGPFLPATRSPARVSANGSGQRG